MNENWSRKDANIQIQRIVKIEDKYAVTLSQEMLDHLKIIEGEDVQVEMRDYELVIRKNIPFDSLKESGADLPRMLHETTEGYDEVLKDQAKHK